MDRRPIGVFDSGIGGLTVVRELVKILPQEKIIYLGDTARVPYGTKSKETVTRFSTENSLFLLKKNVKLIVVACNTASSLSLAFLKKNFSVPVMGVIEPGARKAVSVSRNGRIGVIGTSSTINSQAYQKTIKRMDGTAKVFVKSCPLFVPLAEEGWIHGNIVRSIVSEYLSKMLTRNIDTLVLGCTHYPILRREIRNVVSSGDINIVDSAGALAHEVKRVLVNSGALSGVSGKRGYVKYFVTDETAKFSEVGARFLGKRVCGVKRTSVTV